MSALAERILKRIEDLDTNPSRVSNEAGLSRSAVRDIVSGQSASPSIATIEALCGPLKCSIGYLIGFEEQVPIFNPIGKFWMVHGINQRAPVCRHYSEDEAKTEALRLAKVNPEVVFVVLEATSAFRSDQPRVVEISVEQNADDRIPF